MSQQKSSARALKLSTGKKSLFAMVATVVGLLLLEGLVSGVRIAGEFVQHWKNPPRVVETRSDHHCEYDEELGWISRKGISIPDYYGDGVLLSTNTQGLRGQAEFPKEHNSFRVVCLGDSFTLGYGVADRMSFPAQMQQQNSAIEVVNMGQGGYSVGQSYLWLKRLGPELDPNLVVCVWIVEDFRRLSITRGNDGYGTPQFAVMEDELVVSNIPVPKKLKPGTALPVAGKYIDSMRKHSSLVRSLHDLTAPVEYNEDDVLLFVGLHVLQEIRKVTKKLDSRVAVVLIPTVADIFDPKHEMEYESYSTTLSTFLERENVTFLDLMPAFKAEEKTQALFLDEVFHHFSEAGNALVARELNLKLPQLISEFPVSKASPREE